MTACVVFDFDGVLVDSNAAKRGAYHEIFAPLCRDAGRVVEEVLRSDIESDRYEVIRAILGRLAEAGVDPGAGPPDELLADYAERYNRICEEHAATCQEIPGASSALVRLSARYPLYLISATPESPLRRIVERRGWSEHFRAVLGRPRSKHENLATVLRRERVGGEEIVFVGDGRRDLEAAGRAGCRFIGVRNSFNDFDTRGLLLIDDLYELPARIDAPPNPAPAVPAG